MLQANEAVAEFMCKRGQPTVYRVHENPDPEKLRVFAQFARPFGYRIDPGQAGGYVPVPGRAARREKRPQAAYPADAAAALARPRALCGRLHRPLRPQGEILPAFHLAHPALSRPRRAPDAAKGARRRSVHRRRPKRVSRRPRRSPPPASRPRTTASAISTSCSSRRI